MRRSLSTIWILTVIFLMDASTVMAQQQPAGERSPEWPPIGLLYHQDHHVRIATIKALAATEDLSLIDDLIRAKSVEFYTPVHNTYNSALRSMSDGQGPSKGANWKHWLAVRAADGRLTVDYLPIDLEVLSAKDREMIQPHMTRQGPEHFAEVTVLPLSVCRTNHRAA